MNILISGANGLLGRHLIRRLCQHHHVVALVRPKTKLFFKQNAKIHVLEIDLGKFSSNILPCNIDAVYYLAQSKRFREFPAGALDMLEVNIHAPLQIINWAIQTGVKQFFHASSGGVYRNPGCPVKEFFDINANEKNGFYLDSKLSAELLLKNYSHYFATFAIIRPFFIYGPKQGKTMLIPRLIRNITTAKKIMLNGKEGIKLNPIYVDDAATAFEKLINLTGEFLFNIAGNEIISLKQLANLIGEIIHEVPVFTYNQTEQSDLVADITLMRERLHEPEISLKEGISKIVQDIGEEI